MPATEPEQIHRLFEQAFNAADLEGLLALYEPDATLVPQPDVVVEGIDGIRDALRWFLDRKGRITIDSFPLHFGRRIERTRDISLHSLA